MRIVQKSLTQEAAETMVHAFVTSRMDYCNSILYGASAVHKGLFKMYSTQQHDSFFIRESMIASLLQFVTHCTNYRFSRG